jgi:gas vesicle protein
MNMVKRKQPEDIVKDVEDKFDVKPLLITAAAGALVGVVLTALLKSQKGPSLRKGLTDKYNEIKEEYIDAPKPHCRGKNLATLGLVAGSVVGAASIYLYSTKSGQKLCKEIKKACDHSSQMCLTEGLKLAGFAATENIKGFDWLDFAKQIGEKLQGEVTDPEAEEELEEVEEETTGKFEKVQDVVKLAVLGLQIWQNLKNRR